MRWHRAYEVEGSHLQQRVAIVQRHVRDAIDAGARTVLSLCAGQGRDVIGALAAHPRRNAVRARLVERDPQLAADAQRAATAAGLHRVEVVCADASTTDAAIGVAPVDVLLLCGIFGNVRDDDIRATIEQIPALCAAGATIIWTRHRKPPDRTPTIRAWFAAGGFEELAWATPAEYVGVGAHRMTTDPRPFGAGVRLFRFVGDGSGAPAVEFRRAVRADLEQIVALLADDEIAGAREAGSDLAGYERAFAAIDADVRNVLAVGDDGERIVATAQLTFVPNLTRQGAERMQIEGVRVHRDVRGNGIGRSMMEWAITQARARGCGLAQLTSDKRRVRAIAFYGSLGFVPTHEGMKLDLSSRRAPRT